MRLIAHLVVNNELDNSQKEGNNWLIKYNSTDSVKMIDACLTLASKLFNEKDTYIY